MKKEKNETKPKGYTTISQEKYDKLMKEYKPDGYSWKYFFSEKGNGILFCTSRSTHAAYLINTTEKEAVQLIDDNGRMVAFTLEDVDPKVIEMDVDSCNAENLIARYRFYVYDFRGGQAQVDWTVMPDGRYFADEDGYGAEECAELTATGIIDIHGVMIKPFTVISCSKRKK
ncbi:MAG: hypothetical protein KBT20_10195 [Bacteroidales bacterium]|nr:hypothetical protein [Candidatus Liminaster caballi]